MVSWSYDAGHASIWTTQGKMHVVDRVVGSERLAAMKMMYDGVAPAESQPPSPRMV